MKQSKESAGDDWTILVPGDIYTYPPPRKRIEAVFAAGVLFDTKYPMHAFAKRCSLSAVEVMLYHKTVGLEKIVAWRLVNAR